MGKLETAAIALIALVVLGACLGAGSDDGDNGTDVEENGEAEAEAAEEETDGADEEEAGESGEDEEADEIETDEESDSGDTEVEEGDDETEEAESEVEEEADEGDLSRSDMEFVFEMTLAEEGISVDRAEHTSSGFEVEYVSTAQTEQQLAGEIGYVAGAYAGVVGEGHGEGGMTVDVYAANGVHAFTYTVDEDLARSYYNGEITGEEFGAQVIDTIEVHD